MQLAAQTDSQRQVRPTARARSAARRGADAADAGAASSSVCPVQRTSGNSPGAAWLYAAATDARRPARPALPDLRETMARESPSVTCLPQREILAQRLIERLVCNKQL